jgi:hypothetical protein
MKVASALMAALFVLAASGGNAVAQSGTFNACVLDQGYYDRFARELGWSELNRQGRFPQLMECFVQLDAVNNEHNENVEFAEFAPRMYMALLKANPEAFIHIIARHPAEFRHLLERLESGFVWESGPPNPLEDELRRITLLVEAAHVAPEDRAVRARLLQALQEVQPRTID